MKALILAAGRGKRLGKITESTNKCMLIFNGKPVLEYNIERAADIAEISEIVIVVGHRAEDIINAYGTEYKGKRIKYVIQWEQKGRLTVVLSRALVTPSLNHIAGMVGRCVIQVLQIIKFHWHLTSLQSILLSLNPMIRIVPMGQRDWVNLR